MTKINIGQKTVFTVPTELDSEKYLSGDGTWKSVASALSGDAPVNVSDEGKISVDVFEGSKEGWPECDFEVQEFEVGDGGSSTLHLTAEASEIPSTYTFNAIAHNITINSNFGYINWFDTVGQYMNDCSAYVGNDTTDRSLVKDQLIGTWDTLVFKFTTDKGEGGFDHSCYIQYEKSVKDGKSGLVPAPTTSEAGFFLSADGTWKSAMTHISGNDPISVSESGIIYAKEFLGKGQQLESADFSCTEVVDGVLHCELAMYPPALPDYFMATLYLRKLSESDNFTSIQFDATGSSIYKFTKTVKVTEEQATKIKEAIAMTQITLLVDGDSISFDTTVTGTGIPGLVPNTSRVLTGQDAYFLNAKGKWAKPKNDTYSGAEPVKVDENNVISVDTFEGAKSYWPECDFGVNSFTVGAGGDATLLVNVEASKLPSNKVFTAIAHNITVRMSSFTYINVRGSDNVAFGNYSAYLGNDTTDRSLVRTQLVGTWDTLVFKFTADKGENEFNYSCYIQTEQSIKDGKKGLVPAPTTSEVGYFLNADGTWKEVEPGDSAWYGTRAEYDALAEKEENKIYVITDESGNALSYTAGNNIQISGTNVISATDTKYTAGANVSISSSNVISAVDTKYTAGNNVYITADNAIGAIDTIYAAGDGITIENDVISANTFAGVGSKGMVPTPTADESKYFLRGDGTWTKVEGSGGSYTAKSPVTISDDNVIGVTEFTGVKSNASYSSTLSGTYGEGSSIHAVAIVRSQPSTGTVMSFKLEKTYTETIIGIATETTGYPGTRRTWTFDDASKTKFSKMKEGEILYVSFTQSTFSSATIIDPTPTIDGTSGVVVAPAPSAADGYTFLRSDGNWRKPTDTTYTAGSGISISGNVISSNLITDISSAVRSLSSCTIDSAAAYTIGNVVFVSVKFTMASDYTSRAGTGLLYMAGDRYPLVHFSVNAIDTSHVVHPAYYDDVWLNTGDTSFEAGKTYQVNFTYIKQ